MTLKEWLEHGETQLRVGSHPDRARRDAETLLLHLIGKNRAWLLAHQHDDFAGCKAIGYATLLNRRQKGEPIQYITGETEFYGLPFRVTPDVLIPRPETEHLVEAALGLIAQPTPSQPQTLGAPSFRSLIAEGSESNQPDSPPAPPRALDASTTLGAPGLDSETWESNELHRFPRILDIGTGSGAIAISLAHALPQAQVTATDISAPALAIAQENAARNQVTVRFLQGDLLAPVSGECFDLIVSNPPYVPESDRPSLSVEVRDHEPALALFAGSDGLDIYRRLIPAAFTALTPGGYLALEIGFGQSGAVHALLAAAGYARIEFAPDLQGIPRVAIAKRP